jgi:hypothetical protein
MRAPDSIKNSTGMHAESPEWESLRLQIFPQKKPLLDPRKGIPVRSEDTSCGKFNSTDQLTE